MPPVSARRASRARAPAWPVDRRGRDLCAPVVWRGHAGAVVLRLPRRRASRGGGRRVDPRREPGRGEPRPGPRRRRAAGGARPGGRGRRGCCCSACGRRARRPSDVGRPQRRATYGLRPARHAAHQRMDVVLDGRERGLPDDPRVLRTILSHVPPAAALSGGARGIRGPDPREPAARSRPTTGPAIPIRLTPRSATIFRTGAEAPRRTTASGTT